MGKLAELRQKVKTVFPEAIDFSSDSVIQSGIYLLFSEMRYNAWREDICVFSILISANSMHEDKNSILDLIDELRDRLGSKSARAILGTDTFSNVSVGNFKDMLYVYELKFEIKIYREMSNEIE